MSSPTRTPSRTQLQPAYPARDLRTREILDELGGPEALIEVLELITHGEPDDQLPSKERQLLERLCDPSLSVTGGKPVALPTHMKAVGLLLPDVIDLYRRCGIALAVAKSGRQMDGVLEGVGRMAQERWVICGRCKGESEVIDTSVKVEPGEDPVLRDCPECYDAAVDRSTGKVLKEPNLEAVQIYLGVHGIGKKAGGAPVNVNVNATAQAGARASSGSDDRKPQQQEHVTDRVQAMLEGGGSGGGTGG